MESDRPASAAELGAVTVQDLDGRARRLGEAWAERTAVLAFIRHFG